MARGNQTFQKRQRENKLREKAQQKRERRQQKQAEKKLAPARETTEFGEQAIALESESVDGGEPGDGNEPDNGAGISQSSETDQVSDGWTLNQARPDGPPQIGGTMASKLFVGNLPRGVTDGILADFVTNGGFQVASAVVIRDRMTGDPKGFGFVELAEGEDLQRAIKGLDGQMLEQNRLNVNEARPQRTGGFGGPRGGSGGGGGGRGRGGFAGRGRY
ncbi:MAG: RNA recognition motif domain-containing protein [Terriglobia bacterium]